MILSLALTAAYLAIGVATARLATRKGYDSLTAELLLLLWPVSVAYAAWTLVRWTLRWLATGELPPRPEK